MIRGLYRLLTDLSGPVLTLWLKARAKRGKENAARLSERRGVASLARPDGALAWVHAASVGEALSVLPLVKAMTAQDWSVVVTTGTVTSADILAARLPAKAVHQFAPLDRFGWVKRFLDHWRPNLVVWTESELWPNTLAAIVQKKIPAVMVNGRLSDRAYAGWRRWPGFGRDILKAFTVILAQSEEDRRRFTALGGADVRTSGNLKLATPELPADASALAALRTAAGNRPRWLAASIHPGEDAIVVNAHNALKGRHAGLLTIAVPRHAARGADMAALAAARGLRVARRSAGEVPSAATDIYIADTMGELGLFYRLCGVAFMGKSLAVGGGQNPAEAAQLGCALVLGPDMGNFRDMAAELVSTGAAVQVPDAAGLQMVLDQLLGDADERQKRGAAAKAVIARHARALDETMTVVTPFLGASR